jgi:hypothetical protein
LAASRRCWGGDVTAPLKIEHAATDDAPARPTYRLVLRAMPGVDAERALRALVKIARRKFGLKCTGVEEVPGEATQ